MRFVAKRVVGYDKAINEARYTALTLCEGGEREMSLNITQQAADWYKKELGLQSGDYIRFYARYSNTSDIHPGFSLGIATEEPNNPGLTQDSEGITFYMEEKDLWYLDGYRLNVTYLTEQDDILYAYERE